MVCTVGIWQLTILQKSKRYFLFTHCTFPKSIFGPDKVSVSVTTNFFNVNGWLSRSPVKITDTHLMGLHSAQSTFCLKITQIYKR